MSPTDSRVGLKISIAYGFNQLLCHFYNFLFPHCKAGRDTEIIMMMIVMKHQLQFPESLCARQTLCWDLRPHRDRLICPCIVPAG